MLLGNAWSSPLLLLMVGFQIWMLIDAIRREEWIWAAFIFFFSGFSALLYFFYVYRATPSATIGFELPGTHDRRRIKELQDQIHHLDKPHHYLQLGDIYFQKGNLVKAAECYRASIERDPADVDARAHIGQCLLRQQRSIRRRPHAARRSLPRKSAPRLRPFAHGLCRNPRRSRRKGRRRRCLETSPRKPQLRPRPRPTG